MRSMSGARTHRPAARRSDSRSATTWSRSSPAACARSPGAPRLRAPWSAARPATGRGSPRAPPAARPWRRRRLRRRRTCRTATARDLRPRSTGSNDSTRMLQEDSACILEEPRWACCHVRVPPVRASSPSRWRWSFRVDTERRRNDRWPQCRRERLPRCVPGTIRFASVPSHAANGSGSPRRHDPRPLGGVPPGGLRSRPPARARHGRELGDLALRAACARRAVHGHRARSAGARPVRQAARRLLARRVSRAACATSSSRSVTIGRRSSGSRSGAAS